MDERRQYFRIKNYGEINASLSNRTLEVIEISSKGVLVIKKHSDVPKKGKLTIKIHNFSMDLGYKVLRVEKESMVLLFINEKETKELFVVLKKIRDERKHKVD